MRTPALWHIPVSHFNEKARWALDYKGVEHERHGPPPPAHIPIALWKTRGRSKTFPLLVLADGTAIGDSTEIIAALERLYPEPPLYPADPEQRRRALDLEDFFDEEVGASTRLFAFSHLIEDDEAVGSIAAASMPERFRDSRRVRQLAAGGAGVYVKARYHVDRAAEREAARIAILAGLDRLEAELAAGEGEYLVGDTFTVADLTAAALLGPVALPPEGPQVPEPTPDYRDFQATVADRPGFAWIGEMFSRHRRNARRP